MAAKEGCCQAVDLPNQNLQNAEFVLNKVISNVVCDVCVCVGFVMCGCFGNMYTVL